MLVTKKNFDAFLSEITKHKEIGFDTETFTGHWWQSKFWRDAGLSPGVFSMQFSASRDLDFYLDFLHTDDKLGDKHFEIIHRELAQNPDILWFIQNAKFDLHQSMNHGVEFAGIIHCTQAQARVMNSVEEKLSLDTLGEKYLGQNKVDIKPMFAEEGMTTKVKKWGRNEKYAEQPRFDKIPLETMLLYGPKDTRLCYEIGKMQVENIRKMSDQVRVMRENSSYKGLPWDVMEQERRLTKTLFKMERRGVKIDREYTERIYNLECDKYEALQKEMDSQARRATGIHDLCVDWGSAKQLKPIFEALNLPYSYTEAGNASFDGDALKALDHDLAKMILDYRFHYKRAHTYFENFIWLADDDGFLHADVQQGGTQTGRMSYWEPNLQNLPKRADKGEENPVRKCFVPRSPDHIFFDPDYDQMEYRLMMEYANEKSLVDKVNAGLDVHTATQQEMNIESRDHAKTVNFLTLYGGGEAKLALSLDSVDKKIKITEGQLKSIAKLAFKWRGAWSKEQILKALGTSWVDGVPPWQFNINLEFSEEHFEAAWVCLWNAKNLRDEYFRKLPGITAFLKNVKTSAKARGLIVSWAGRVLKSPPGTDYKMPNALIQGGCGDVVKKAMVEIDNGETLEGATDTALLIQVHDELLIEMHKDDFAYASKILEVMSSVYPSKLLKLTSGASYSEKSWAELTEGLPST